jgi:protein SCO1/2
MREVQDFIEKEKITSVKLLSITVDPERDTPEILNHYGRSYGANNDVWQFLTGDSEMVQKTVVQGFRMAMGKEQTSEDPNIFGIMHGERFLIIDEKQQIRGFFDVSKEDSQGFDFGFNHLISSLKILSQNKPS